MSSKKLSQFLSHANMLAAVYSKDRSSQVAALLIDSEDYTTLASGYNGIPRGCLDHLEERHTRPLKYDYAEHAERNAIFNFARPYLQGAIVITNEALTMANVRALISINIAEVWSTRKELSLNPQELDKIRSFFEEANIPFYHCADLTSIRPEFSRHRRKVYQAASVLSSLSSNLAKDPLATDTVILSNGDYTRISEGYSGVPRGFNDKDPSWYEGAQRLLWVEDSIRNAIFNKVRPFLKGATAVVTHRPCVDCARAFASVGIRRIAAAAPSADFLSRWGAQSSDMFLLLKEANIEYIEV